MYILKILHAKECDHQTSHYTFYKTDGRHGKDRDRFKGNSFPDCMPEFRCNYRHIDINVNGENQAGKGRYTRSQDKSAYIIGLIAFVRPVKMSQSQKCTDGLEKNIKISVIDQVAKIQETGDGKVDDQ